MEVLKNPIPYTGEILLAVALPKVALCRFLYSAYVDRKEFVKFFSGLQQLMMTNQEEAIAQIAVFGMECTLTGRIIKDTSQLSKRTKEFVWLKGRSFFVV